MAMLAEAWGEGRGLYAGSVVASGVGLPRWAATCQELEPLDSTRTKISQV